MPSATSDSSIPLDDDTPPTSIDPYAVLSLTKEATPDEIKRSYRKLALKNHPDKASSEAEKATAHTKFQEIAFAYAILSDPKRKARYDVTGRTDESLTNDDDGDFSWSTFYRAQFKDVVSDEVIEDFARSYKGSDEEKDDVLAAYEEAKGDMDVVFETVMLSDPVGDEERFRKWIDEAIESGEVEAFKAFTGESKKKRAKRVKNARKEEQEAEELAKELGIGKKKKGGEGGEDELKALIRKRQEGREQGGFLERLEAKYASSGGKKSKKGRKAAEEEDEPPEELFERNRKKSKKA